MKAAELFVRCLEAEGVEYVFALPGEENADLMLALEDSPIQVVIVRHEQGAAFMADAYGRLTGKAAVALGTLGPGATNLTTGVANGNMDRAPMVVVTGQADRLRQHKESHQAVDVVGLFRPITKWATPVLDPKSIPEIVRKAFKLATAQKPGACHIELAEDVAEMEVDGAPLQHLTNQRAVPDCRTIEDACEAIRKARRPVILAGNGVIRSNATEQLREFVDATGIGVVSTFMGKGVIPRHSEQCLFTIGLQAKDLIACTIDAADLVITLGYDMVEYPPRLWNANGDKKIIHIDSQPAEVDDCYTVAVEVVGDLVAAMKMMNTCAGKERPVFDSSQQHAVREQMLADFAEHKDDDTEGAIRPQKVLWDVRQAMGPNDILLSDVGAHKMWVARYYHCDEPNTCLITNGFCAMGFSMPGAVAAKLVYPDRRVLVVCGDGGFLMNLQELETARRLMANIVVMVWVDGDYGLISWKQENEFGRHTNMAFTNPDFVRLAESFGCRGIQVNRSRDLADALDEAFSADCPVIVALPIDYRENRLLTERLGKIVCPI